MRVSKPKADDISNQSRHTLQHTGTDSQAVKAQKPSKMKNTTTASRRVAEPLIEKVRNLTERMRRNRQHAIVGAKDAVSERIYAVMKDQGVTQAELARRLEKSPAYISKVLAGGENLTVETMVVIGLALDHELQINYVPAHAVAQPSLNQCLSVVRLQKSDPTKWVSRSYDAQPRELLRDDQFSPVLRFCAMNTAIQGEVRNPWVESDENRVMEDERSNVQLEAAAA